MINRKWFVQGLLAMCISHSAGAEDHSMIESTGWELWPDLTLTELLSYGGSVKSTDALPLSGGRYALIIYVKAEGEHGALWRCIDIADKNLHPVEQNCFKLLHKSYIKNGE